MQTRAGHIRASTSDDVEPHMAGPLNGVKILDCTSVVLGPCASQQHADLGAAVRTIEPPEGHTTR